MAHDRAKGQEKQFPWEIEEVESNQAAELMKYLTAEETGFVRVGPKGYFLPHKYKQEASKIFNMPLRDTDIFLTTYPRSGSTWMREFIWMVCNDLNYAQSDAIPLAERFTFFEYPMLFHSKLKEDLLKETDQEKLKLIKLITQPSTERVASSISPRFIFAHLPLSLLPPNILDTVKMIYVARDPRDVAVSLYHMSRHKLIGYVGDFKSFWNLFVNDQYYWTPFFEHVKEAWNTRHHSNILFFFYEDISKNLPETVRRVSSFFNKQYSEDQVAALCEHLSIENFRTNKSINYAMELGMKNPGEQPFIRNGKSGGWSEYFDDDMTQQADRWIIENLQDTDLRFPSMTHENKYLS